MPVKIFVFDLIKKLMGWCPYAKTFETGSRITPANFEAYDQSGGEKASEPEALSQLSRLFTRYDVRILLPTLFFTFYLIILISQKGINSEAFLLGLSLSLLTYLLGWKKQMNKYNTLAKKPAVVSSFKKTFIWVISVIILGLILFMVLLSHLSHILYFLNAQSMYSFIAGAWILMWGSYLQLIYWEKENHMKIYIKSEKGFQKMYALGEKEREL
ncbi:hypothetical protein DU52_01720 [Methanosarcina mazei]|uniref:DUF1673 domain-containing protein n=1 Tax=Methanosarcina mazei TaxID=2209 RepID=A0A0F8GA85_METMZ|nr:DUF1673 domain-containing protein [Methanosarcina mazei]KKG29130.1 hypothetical protein DU52_01720 [Methanosarcina mazei]